MSPPLKIRLRSRPLRTLVYDIENKPGTYGGGDFTHGKVTAIGCRFLGDDGDVKAWVLRRSSKAQMRRCAVEFGCLWEKADRVLGHNIRQHDQKLIDGLYVMLDLPLLPRRLMIDTWADAVKTRGFSRSLENQCARWDCPEQKVQMPEHVWEAAYDEVPWGMERMHERVTSDVRMNTWLYHELRRRELL